MFEARESVDITIKSNGLRLTGTIRYTDGKQVLIICSPEHQSDIQAGTAIELVQPCPDGGLYLIDTVISLTNENNFRAALTPVRFLQRRRQPRFPCQLPTNFGVQGAGSLSRMGMVYDISLGGAKLRCTEKFSPGVLLDMDIDISGNEHIQASAQILRCTKMREPIACEFGELTHELALKYTQIARVHQMQLQRFLTILTQRKPEDRLKRA